MNEKVSILNCHVDLCGVEDALERVLSAINENINFQIVTINPEMIINAQKNKAFFDIVDSADLVIPDGVGVKIALRLKGIKINQIRGIDFSRLLIKTASQKGYKIGLLGAKEEVIQKAKENILKEFPTLDIAYIRNGYFSDDNEIIEQIKNADLKILLVGLGSPKQEELIYKLKSELKGTAMIGVGGSFDVFSGIVKEAPLIYRKLGLEWLYRTILQPERFKRIFPLLPIFLIKCIISTVMNKD